MRTSLKFPLEHLLSFETHQNNFCSVVSFQTCVTGGRKTSSDVLWTSMNIRSDITTHLYSASYINYPNVWNAALHNSSCRHDSKQFTEAVCLLVTNSTTDFTIFFLRLWPFKQGLHGPGVNTNIWMAPRTKAGQKTLLCYQPLLRDKLVIFFHQHWFESLLQSQTNLYTRKAQLQKKKKYLNEILFMFVKFW